MQTITVSRDGYEINTDRQRLDRDLIYDFLVNRSYWARGIPRSVVERSIENSLCFGMYCGDRQVGFARIVTDSATFAYLADVFIVEAQRGRGLGKWLIEVVVGHPDLQGLRQISLGTRDAHGLYERYGFKRLADTTLGGSVMAIHNPNIYTEKGG